MIDDRTEYALSRLLIKTEDHGGRETVPWVSVTTELVNLGRWTHA